MSLGLELELERERSEEEEWGCAAVRHGLTVGMTLVVCVVAGPVMWALWIHNGSANANFYFGVTLAYSTALVSLAGLPLDRRGDEG